MQQLHPVPCTDGSHAIERQRYSLGAVMLAYSPASRAKETIPQRHHKPRVTSWIPSSLSSLRLPGIPLLLLSIALTSKRVSSKGSHLFLFVLFTTASSSGLRLTRPSNAKAHVQPTRKYPGSGS